MTIAFPIVQTKLHRPPLQADFVPRPALVKPRWSANESPVDDRIRPGASSAFPQVKAVIDQAIPSRVLAELRQLTSSTIKEHGIVAL